VGKSGVLAEGHTKAAISLNRENVEEKLLWRAYRNSSTLVFPKIGGSQPHPKLQSLLSQER